MRSSRCIVDKFEFDGAVNDIFEVEDFIEDVYRFNRVVINNEIKLF